MGAAWVINLAVAEWAIRRRPARASATPGSFGPVTGRVSGCLAEHRHLLGAATAMRTVMTRRC